MSGDEFVILCEDLEGEAEAHVVAERISAGLAAPYSLSTTEVKVTASIGVAFASQGVYAPQQLLQDADAAMYQAKRKGGNRYQVIDLREQHLDERRRSLSRELEGAAGRGELRLQHQPIVTALDRRIAGAEALLRWAHPERGMMAPATFIPLAEEFGLITDIGLWALGQACLDRSPWQNGGKHDVGISVNVSAQQLLSSDFPAIVQSVLLATRTDPGLLTLELTETVFLEDGERALVVFEQLKNLGVLLALDDFGIGFSSLSYLRQFPVDIIKIDKSFTTDLESDPASLSIVSAVIRVAHELGMVTIAEGVETPSQCRQVAALGSDFCQGYYFARPMSALDFETMMRHGDLEGSPRLPLLAMAPGLGAAGQLGGVL